MCPNVECLILVFFLRKQFDTNYTKQIHQRNADINMLRLPLAACSVVNATSHLDLDAIHQIATPYRLRTFVRVFWIEHPTRSVQFYAKHVKRI